MGCLPRVTTRIGRGRFGPALKIATSLQNAGSSSPIGRFAAGGETTAGVATTGFFDSAGAAGAGTGFAEAAARTRVTSPFKETQIATPDAARTATATTVNTPIGQRSRVVAGMMSPPM